MIRYSKQREEILSNLSARSDHPTAEMIYDSVRRDLPRISLGTVHRNLREMADNREILSFTINGKEHFDGNASLHLHLVCTHCGEIWDRPVDSSLFSWYYINNSNRYCY